MQCVSIIGRLYSPYKLIGTFFDVTQNDVKKYTILFLQLPMVQLKNKYLKSLRFKHRQFFNESVLKIKLFM